MSQTRSPRRSSLQLYLTWNESEIENLEQRKKILKLNSCTKCNIVYFVYKSHTCNAKSRLILEKSLLKEKDKRFKEGISVDNFPILKSEKLALGTNTTVVKKCLISSLKSEYKDQVLEYLNYHVFENHSTTYLASRLLNLHFLRLKDKIENVDTTLIKNALRLVSRLENDREDENIQDKYSLKETYWKYFYPLFPKNFIWPSCKTLTSTSHEDSVTKLFTNFENYYEATWRNRTWKWIKLQFLKFKVKLNIKTVNQLSSLILSIIIGEKEEKELENLNLEKEVFDISGDILNTLEIEFECNYLNYLKEKNMTGKEKSVNKLGYTTPIRWIIPWMNFMLNEFTNEKEKYPIKLFTIFPIVQNVPNHLTCNQQFMRILYESVTNKKIGKSDTIWQIELFKLEPKFWTGWTQLLTDGISICFSQTRNFYEERDNKDKKVKKKKIKESNKIQEAERYISIDTNRRNLFVAAERTKESIKEYRDIKYALGNGEWKTIRGLKKYNHKLKFKLEQNKFIQELINSPNMATKGNIEVMINHISFISLNWNNLFSFYHQKWFRRSRMNNYIASEKGWTYVRDKLNLSSTIDRKSSLIILGDGAFNCSSTGHDPTPSANKMYHKLKRLGCRIVWQDEFRTSKLCSCCSSIVEPLSVKINDKRILDKNKLESINKRYSEPWGLRICSNKLCRKIWDRDMNACINMLNLYLKPKDKDLSGFDRSIKIE
jgi:hypothetical protein